VVNFANVCLFCVGSVFLGAAILMYLLINVAAKNGSDSSVDNFFGFLFSLVPGVLAVLFFYLGFSIH
jgi:hypothetical protein